MQRDLAEVVQLAAAAVAMQLLHKLEATYQFLCSLEGATLPRPLHR